MMPLGLSPLPVAGPEGRDERPASAGWQDFVSDEAVSEVVAGGSISRLPVLMTELALSSSDEDFAGTAVTCMASAPPARFAPAIDWPEAVEQETPAFEPAPAQPLAARFVSRAKPPELHEWESSSPRVSLLGHRWWIPGLAGVAATMVFAAVLFSLSAGPAPATGLLEIPKPQPLKPLRVADPSVIAPEDQPAVASASLLAP